MWAAIVSLVLGVVKWLFWQRQATEGEALGKSEQAVADRDAELAAVSRAEAARAGVTDDPGALASDPNNLGPAQ